MKIKESTFLYVIRNLEDKIRDQTKTEIIENFSDYYGTVSDVDLKLILGKQVENIPNIQPTEPAIMIESVEEPAKESIHEIMEKFHSEEEPEPPKDSTPPRREFHQMCGFQCQPEKSRQG